MIRIAIAVSEFNSFITNKLLDGALDEAKDQKVVKPFVIKVPGAIELTFAAQQLAQLGKYDAILLLGCIIRGQTDHYTYVCKQVSEGTQLVMMKYNLPIIFGILTTHNMEQALERVGGSKGHKGRYALRAAITMANFQHSLER
jgi:6,7-dimethyl-8-ribityllumazine synthase